MNLEANKAAAVAAFRLIETGDSALAEQIGAPDFVNHEAEDDPDQPDRHLVGPQGFRYRELAQVRFR